jgi:aminoglycoside phosphotransferase
MPSPSLPIGQEALTSALRDAGFAASEGINLEWRTWRWVGQVADDLIVFIPPSKEAGRRLSIEADLLDLVGRRTALHLPQVLYRHPDTGMQVRRKVPGVQIPPGEEPMFGVTANGLTLAKELGEAIADLHSSITQKEGLAIGLSAVEPCRFSADLVAMLQAETAGTAQIDALQQLLTVHRNEPPSKADGVVVHGDIWRGNMAIDPTTERLIGLFDFDDCGLADRHFDLRYAHSFGEDFAARCFAAYSVRSGTVVSARRTAMYHAISAFEALQEALLAKDPDDIRRRRAWVDQVCEGPIGRQLFLRR